MFALARERLVSELNRGAADRCPLGREGRDRAWVAAPRPRVEPEQLPGPPEARTGQSRIGACDAAGTDLRRSMWPRTCSTWLCGRAASVGGSRTTRPGWSSWSRGCRRWSQCWSCWRRPAVWSWSWSRRWPRRRCPWWSTRARRATSPAGAGQDRRARRGRPGALRRGRAATAAALSDAQTRALREPRAASPAGRDAGRRRPAADSRRRRGAARDRGPPRLAGAAAERARGRAAPGAAGVPSGGA